MDRKETTTTQKHQTTCVFLTTANSAPARKKIVPPQIQYQNHHHHLLLPSKLRLTSPPSACHTTITSQIWDKSKQTQNNRHEINANKYKNHLRLPPSTPPPTTTASCYYQPKTKTKQIQRISKFVKEKRTDPNQANENKVRTKSANNINHSPPVRQPPGDLERVVRMAKADRRTTTN